MRVRREGRDVPDLSEESEELLGGSSRSASVILARIRQAIETGVYADGDQLPAERQLAITFGTARSTIRKVLDQLADKNLVVRRVGSGTFVNYAGPIHQGMEDIADLVSPLQLIETRFAVEPYMTRLAALHATGADLDKFEDVLRRIEAAKLAWAREQFPRIPGETERIPLPAGSSAPWKKPCSN